LNRSAEILCETLRSAKKPEDVFGVLPDGTTASRLISLKHRFNEFILVIHPDRLPDLKDPGQYVERLVALRKEAEALLKESTYGKPRKAVLNAVLRSRDHTYKLVEEFRVGEVADLFVGERGSQKCLLKIVRQPSDNDLLDIEARVLSELHRQTGEKARVFQKYLPKFFESFSLVEAGRHRRVNVLDIAEPEAAYLRKLKEKKGVEAPRDYYSLAEIREAYPNGVDARDAAWMIRRAFEVLGWVHSLGYVHGAVLPEHLIVHPLEHGARLVGWSYAVKSGQRLTAISTSRKGMYPKSVFNREPTKPVLDIQLAAESTILLLSDAKGKLRADIPANVAAFFNQCRAGKIKDGWDAYRTFDEVLQKTYGKRAYRAFEMPVK